MSNDDLVAIIMLVIYAIPYFVGIRLLWYIGSWFRDRVKKRDYFIVKDRESNKD